MPVVMAANKVGPAHHALVLPACDCGSCGPTWARRRGRSRRFTEPVTLVMALEAEDAECRAEMVREHRECLSTMVCAADELVATSSGRGSATLGGGPGRGDVRGRAGVGGSFGRVRRRAARAADQRVRADRDGSDVGRRRVPGWHGRNAADTRRDPGVAAGSGVGGGRYPGPAAEQLPQHGQRGLPVFAGGGQVGAHREERGRAELGAPPAGDLLL